MIAALLNGFLGLAITLAIGVGHFGLNIWDVLECILGSNVAAFTALLMTLQAERQPWILKYILNRSLKTWALITTLYFGILLALSPALRDVHVFLVLVLPLMLSTGFCIILFGPVQDYLVRQKQRKSSALTE